MKRHEITAFRKVMKDKIKKGEGAVLIDFARHIPIKDFIFSCTSLNHYQRKSITLSVKMSKEQVGTFDKCNSVNVIFEDQALSNFFEGISTHHLFVLEGDYAVFVWDTTNQKIKEAYASLFEEPQEE